jgi:hypothetical protein
VGAVLALAFGLGFAFFWAVAARESGRAANGATPRARQQISTTGRTADMGELQ